MIQESEIREKLRAFLRNELSQDDFRSWITGTSWNMHRDSSEEARRVVGVIELAFAEYLAGHRRAADMRLFFQRLLQPTKNMEVELSPSESLLLRVRPMSSVPLEEILVGA